MTLKDALCFCSALLFLAGAGTLMAAAAQSSYIEEELCELAVKLTNDTCHASNIKNDDAYYVCYTVLREATFAYTYAHHRIGDSMDVYCTLVVNETLYDTGSEETSKLRATQDYEDSPPTNSTCYHETAKCVLFDEDEYNEDVRKVTAYQMVLVYWGIGLLSVMFFCLGFIILWECIIKRLCCTRRFANIQI